jgi:LysM repeat protein
MQKAGPLPIYAWAGGGLGAALLIARFRTAKQDKQQAQQQPSAASSYASQPEMTMPQFVIQNQLPGYPYPNPWGQVQPPVTAPPVVTPPGGSTNPPMNGGNPPTAGTPGVKNPPQTTPPPAQPKKPPTDYVVQHGDTLGAIAKRYGTTADALFAYNTTPGNRSADAIAKFRKQGINLIYAGQHIYIP